MQQYDMGSGSPDGCQAPFQDSLLDLRVREVGTPLPMRTPDPHAGTPHVLTEQKQPCKYSA